MTMYKQTALVAAENNSETVDVRKLFAMFIDYRWLIIGVTALFTLVGLLYALLATPVYQADAIVQIEQSPVHSVLDKLSEMSQLPTGQSSAEVELLRSRMVLGRAAGELNLENRAIPDLWPMIGSWWLRYNHKEVGKVVVPHLQIATQEKGKVTLTVLDAKHYRIALDGKPQFTGTLNELKDNASLSIMVKSLDAEPGSRFTLVKEDPLTVVERIRHNLRINEKGKDSGILLLTYTDTDPAQAEAILNSVVQSYYLQNIERRSEEAQKSLEFVKTQLPVVRDALNAAEDKLNSFRQKNDSVDLSLEAKSVLDRTVAIETQINELVFREAELSKLYTRAHPAYRALLEKRNTLLKEKEKLNQRIASMPKTQQDIIRLTRDVDSGKAIYMQLLNKQQELSIAKASTTGNVRIIDPALARLEPVKPRKSLIILVMFVLGAVVGSGAVVGISTFQRTIESPEALEQLGINVYANIPLSSWQKARDKAYLSRGGRKKSSAVSHTLLALDKADDLAVESIRSLRTSLHFAMLEAKNNVLMISGTASSIGKTFVSMNLAAVIADAGQKVLIIDADMRKGYAHQMIGSSCERGLSDVLCGTAQASDVVQQTKVANMDFIARGKIPPNPSELLMHPRFQQLIEWASDNYDFVLIDTPPVLAVTDAAIIGQLAGTSLMVARFAYTTLKEIEIGVKRFEQNGVPVKGVILNGVEKKRTTYEYYQYEYGKN